MSSRASPWRRCLPKRSGFLSTCPSTALRGSSGLRSDISNDECLLLNNDRCSLVGSGVIAARLAGALTLRSPIFEESGTTPHRSERDHWA